MPNSSIRHNRMRWGCIIFIVSFVVWSFGHCFCTVKFYRCCYKRKSLELPKFQQLPSKFLNLELMKASVTSDANDNYGKLWMFQDDAQVFFNKVNHPHFIACKGLKTPGDLSNTAKFNCSRSSGARIPSDEQEMLKYESLKQSAKHIFGFFDIHLRRGSSHGFSRPTTTYASHHSNVTSAKPDINLTHFSNSSATETALNLETKFSSLVKEILFALTSGCINMTSKTTVPPIKKEQNAEASSLLISKPVSEALDRFNDAVICAFRIKGRFEDQSSGPSSPGSPQVSPSCESNLATREAIDEIPTSIRNKSNDLNTSCRRMEEPHVRADALNGVLFFDLRSRRLRVRRHLIQALKGGPVRGTWELHFLGTGSMQVSETRGTSSILFVKGDGSSWLFDCGAGASPVGKSSPIFEDHRGIAQQGSYKSSLDDNTPAIVQNIAEATSAFLISNGITRSENPLKKTDTQKRRLGSVTKIFITHLHGDHCLGIPAFLSQIADGSHTSEGEYVEIIGPQGLKSLLRVILRSTHSRRLPAFSIRELVNVPYLHLGTQKQRRNMRISVPPSVSNRFYPSCRRLLCTKLGVSSDIKSMCAANEISVEDIEINADGSYEVYRDSTCTVTAVPIEHTIPTVGYIVDELHPKLRMNSQYLDPIIKRNSADLSDVKRFPHFRGKVWSIYSFLASLNEGEIFEFPDGTIVSRKDILAPLQPLPRKVCFCFDTSDATNMLPKCQGANAIVHEATLSSVGSKNETEAALDKNNILDSTRKSRSQTSTFYDNVMETPARMGWDVLSMSAAAHSRGHSSAAMAGSFAARAKADHLILTHFSQRYQGDSSIRSVLTMLEVEEEARQASRFQIEEKGKSTRNIPLVTAAWDGLTIPIPPRLHNIRANG